jgi:ADP-heptose:LPS heptosyltransferase
MTPARGRAWRLRALDALDVTLGRAACAVLAPRGPTAPPASAAPAAVRRILVIRPGGLGDAVHLLPLLAALRRRYPEAALDLLLERRNAGLVENGFAAHAWLYDRDPPRELLGALRARYDVVIDTEQSRYLSAVVAFLTRAPVRCGFTTNQRGRLFTHPVPYDVHAYEADVFLRLYTAVSGEAPPSGPVALALPPAAHGWAAEMVAPLGGRRLAVIAPAAPIAERQWALARWTEVARRLIADGWTLALVGAPADTAICHAVAGTLAADALVDLSGRASIAQTAAVIARAGLYVASDGGLLHVAHVLGVPTVGLFGATPADKWAPRGDAARTVRHALPCSPCTRFGVTPPCRFDVECLARITVEEVVDAVAAVTSR